MNYLKTIPSEKTADLFSRREGETRIGETVIFFGNDWERDLENFEGKFILIGIPEDIGVRANFGKSGAAGFWQKFLPVFLSIQSNQFLIGDEIAIAGEINCDDLNESSASTTDPVELSALVTALDDRVFEVLEKIFQAGKIPIVIGGGHNNAYPIIKAAASGLEKNLNIINIDPHADLRECDRRHSGNGFSQALKEDLMDFYLQIGLHESYNNEYILDTYKNLVGLIKYYSYDDYLRKDWSMEELENFIGDKFKDQSVGLELDADAIQQLASSAITPSGFSPAEARQLVMTIAKITKPLYFHIPETISGNGSEKLVTYLVTDFIKMV